MSGAAIFLDDHGQVDENYGFNRKRNNDKVLHNLRGLISGVLADDMLVDEEISFLRTWLESKRHQAHGEIIELLDVCADLVRNSFVQTGAREDLRELLESILDVGEKQSDAREDAINELTGLIAGLASDSKICRKEAVFAMQWLDRNSHISDHWTYNLALELVDQVRFGDAPAVEKTAQRAKAMSSSAASSANQAIAGTS